MELSRHPNAADLCPSVVIPIYGRDGDRPVTVPETALVGFRDGRAVAWYGYLHAAERAKERGRIARFCTAAELA
jgi:hypothetical protein